MILILIVLIIDTDFELFHLEYNWDFSTLTRYDEFSKKNLQGKNNKEFYEQFYLYANLLFK